MVKQIFSLLLILVSVPFLAAENNVSVDMELYDTVYRTRNSSFDIFWAYGITGNGVISFKSTGNKNVRADIVTDITFPDSSGIPVILLKKAYVKARFPSFRVTLGKTRLGWGEGFVFNSGDVIFGSTSPYVDLTGTEIRSETAWITSIKYPIGRFSFLEGIIKIPDPINSGFGEIADTSAGVRLYTKAGSIKIEAGYYIDGEDKTYDISSTATIENISIVAFHRPYISLQGNIGPDWYINSSAAIPTGESIYTELIVKDTFSISFGLFHMIEAGYNNSVTFRIETSVLPYLNWNEKNGNPGSYAILIYPEVSLNMGSAINLSIRSIISPLELSAQVTSGFSWNLFEGFNLISFATINGGDGNDTFSWNKSSWDPASDIIDGISVMTGIKYIY